MILAVPIGILQEKQDLHIKGIGWKYTLWAADLGLIYASIKSWKKSRQFKTKIQKPTN